MISIDRFVLVVSLLTFGVGCPGGGGSGGSAAPIVGVEFDPSSIQNTAPGNGESAPDSDNWAITWASNGSQYAAFGDGIGFATTNSTRASNGVARIEGGKDDYSAFDVFKTGGNSPGWDGKSLGILSIGPELFMLRNGTGSTESAFEQTELWISTDDGFSWGYTGVDWQRTEFADGKGFFSPTFLQFGRGYDGARDDFVYVYGNERTETVNGDVWNVQLPGRISLLRVPKDQLEQKNAYEYFSGTVASPAWSTDLDERTPVFEDASNGIMRTSVSFNAPLGQYILITQQANRFESEGYRIGIYAAPEPWGPWTRLLLADPRDVGPGLNTGEKTVYWNLSNKWLSADGRDFVMVYTGPGDDQFGTIEGRFLTN